MRVLCIYDNHIKPNLFIKNIIGEKTFGEVILKRKDIRSRFLEFAHSERGIDEILMLDYDWQLSSLLDKVKSCGDNVHIVHIFSQFILKEEEPVHILFQKAPYIQNNYIYLTKDQYPAAFMMCDVDEYCSFMKQASSALQDLSVFSQFGHSFEPITVKCFYNIGEQSNFLQFISGGFDARFFNSVKGDDFTVIKSSKNKKKIKAEYEFYHLLPDYMKMWFVMPYNYQETETSASYEMERYHMTDLAIRWVHGAIDLEEFDKLLVKVFHFINTRKEKKISKEEYLQLQKELYIDKLEERINELKKHDKFIKLENYIAIGTNFTGIDEIIACYKELYGKVTEAMKIRPISVIGHGDLCFSNMLYNKETDLLKLIDPKGAVKDDQLWTNPYYDVAKLSHSICGRYDFFNNDLHHITLNRDLHFELSIDFENQEYKNLFRKYVEENGYSYAAVRIYEVSLFLSMLPLHLDNLQKVYGFILNAIYIMEEIKICLIK